MVRSRPTTASVACAAEPYRSPRSTRKDPSEDVFRADCCLWMELWKKFIENAPEQYSFIGEVSNPFCSPRITKGFVDFYVGATKIGPFVREKGNEITRCRANHLQFQRSYYPQYVLEEYLAPAPIMISFPNVNLFLPVRDGSELTGSNQHLFPH